MIILGRNQQVNCSENEFYKFLGYVANHPDDVRVVWEHNEQQGAWGSEGRIQFYSNNIRNYFPTGFSFSAGVNNIACRLNCNDLINEMRRLGFVIGQNQNVFVIRQNIPNLYINDFDSGCQL